MDHLIGTALTLGYLALFLFLIWRMRFFRVGNIPIRWFQGVFVLKVMSGFLLYLVYTYYYTDRSTADIWKYYDDAMVMYSALREHPMDYVKMLIGWGTDNRERFTVYYDLMSHWDKPYTQGVANDTHLVIRFNAFVRLFSLGHYMVHAVVINFLGLVGLTGIFRFARQMAPEKEKWLFAGVFLTPGIMFWTSGVLKEPMLLFGLGVFLFALVSISTEGFSVGRMALMVVGLFILSMVKSYALIAIIPGLVAWWISERYPQIHPAVFFTLIYIDVGIVVSVLGGMVQERNIFERLATKQHEFYQLAEGGTYVRIASGDTLYISASDFDAIHFKQDRDSASLRYDVAAVNWNDAKKEHATSNTLPGGTEFYVILDYGRTGSTIDIPKLDGSVWTTMKAVPMAIVNALFRPFPWEIRSPFMALSGLENLFILLLFVLMVLFFRKEALDQPVFYIACFFALIILLLTGLVTPVVGAIVRYKVPALPFLVCGMLALIDTDRIETLGKKLFNK